MFSSKLEASFLKFSLTSFLMTSCGAVEMPSTGSLPGGKKSDDGSPNTGGASETNFDLTKCGFDLNKSGANIASRQMAMVPLKKTVTTKILGGLFTSQTDVNISGMSIAEDSLLRSISTFSAQSAPSVESDEVAAITASRSLGYAAEILPTGERAKIGEHYGDWKGVFCSFQPAMKLERGTTQKIVAEFDKPLPLVPLVVAGIARLTEEMGTRRSWNGITAKVVDSTDPSVMMGATYSGTVTSEPVNPIVAVDSATGKVTVQADLAVKMTYNFGSEAHNKSLGLPKAVTWFVDAASKSYKLMQVDFGDGVLVPYFPN